MQPKASMVVPCYNKVKYIGAFFESVYAQKWDNIELILVNNASNDGTENIISEWEPRFKARGYTVIRIDLEENQGVAGAVKAGMLCATGKYFCTVDCDDELDPEYVSKMAGFLEENPEYEWAACDYLRYTDTENGRVYASEHISLRESPEADCSLQYALGRLGLPIAVWVLMTRRSYLDKCKVIERYDAEKCLTQELPYSMPLAVGGGKLKVFTDRLYRYNRNPSQMSTLKEVGEALDYHKRFLDMATNVIESLDCTDKRKKELYFIEKSRFFSLCLGAYREFAPDNPDVLRYARELSEHINRSFTPNPNISAEDFTGTRGNLAHIAVGNCILKRGCYKRGDKGRIIACCALGKIGQKYLPELEKTSARPDVLWDSGSKPGETMFGRNVTSPDYDSLSADDTVLILSTLTQTFDEIKGECVRRGVTNFINYYGMLYILSAHYFPQFYGECGFTPEGR